MGTSLQAYAMYKLFFKLGHQVEVLDYDEYAHFIMWRVKPAFEKVLFSVLKLFSPLSKRFCLGQYTALQRANVQRKKFKEFEKAYIPLTKRKYKSSEELSQTNGQYDVYVCGSDQIWSPMMFDPAFYLDFVDKKRARTIAYAPSLGVTDPKFISDNAKSLIRNMNSVSCRETEGAKVLSEITEKEIPTVLDPTLMLDVEDWDEITPPDRIIQEEYILTYFLHTRFFEDNIPHAFISKLKEKTGCLVVNIQMHNMQQVVNADLHLYECGPCEFLSLVKCAKYVVTNSFHCCIFSSVIYTLLQTLDSSSSLITNETDDLEMLLDSKINNNQELYLLRRKESFDYLEKALHDL